MNLFFLHTDDSGAIAMIDGEEEELLDRVHSELRPVYLAVECIHCKVSFVTVLRLLVLYDDRVESEGHTHVVAIEDLGNDLHLSRVEVNCLVRIENECDTFDLEETIILIDNRECVLFPIVLLVLWVDKLLSILKLVATNEWQDVP